MKKNKITYPYKNHTFLKLFVRSKVEKDAAEIQQHLFLKILFYVLHAEAESAHLILTKAYNLYNLS